MDRAREIRVMTISEGRTVRERAQKSRIDMQLFQRVMGLDAEIEGNEPRNDRDVEQRPGFISRSSFLASGKSPNYRTSPPQLHVRLRTSKQMQSD
jgi:hypothetical protein